MTIDEESYWNGRFGNSIMGGNPAEYARGQRDALNNQGGIHPILLIVLLFILLPTIVATLMSSLAITTLLKVFINRRTQKNIIAPFGKLLMIIFSVSFLWQLLSSVFMILLYVLIINNVEIPGLSNIVTEKNTSSIIILLMVICEFLAALLSGFMLKKKFSSHPSFTGLKGYLLSVFMLVIFVLPIVILCNYIVAKQIGNYFSLFQQ